MTPLSSYKIVDYFSKNDKVKTYFYCYEFNMGPVLINERKIREHEKITGMTEGLLYEQYGLIFNRTEKKINIDRKLTYKIQTDNNVMIWLIRKGYVTYNKGREKWNYQALEEGWEDGWTPNPDSVIKKKIESGHVYFYKSAGSHKIGCSCAKNIKKRLYSQYPDEVLAISEASEDYKDLEKKIHRMFSKNQVGRYEIFNDLTDDEVQKIKKMLGNTIAVKVKLRRKK